jgi:hypothetical protein
MRDLAQQALQRIVGRVAHVTPGLSQRRAQQVQEVATLSLQLGFLDATAL